MAVVGGVFQGVSMYNSLRLDNPFMQELAAITRKLQRGKQLTMMDEVTALEDLYQLTGDPISAAYGWEYWKDSLY